MPKFLILDRFESQAHALLKASLEETTELSEAEGIIIRSKTKVDKAFLDKAKNLKVLITATSGFDHIDLEEAEKRNVKCMYTPEGNAQSAAELAWGLLLATMRKVPQAHRAVKDVNWDRQALLGNELQGKTIGIIGLGRVGSRVANFAKAFGMNVQAYDPYIDEFPDFVEPDGLMEVLRSSDIISLHVPLTKETRHLINYQTIEHINLKPVLINTSRGQVICENDLIMALEKGIISAAGLDVFEKEPLPKDSALIRHKKIVLSPHIGATTTEAFAKVSRLAAEKLLAFFKDEQTSDILPLKTRWVTGPFHTGRPL